MTVRSRLNLAVLGAGNSGFAAAAHCSLMGCRVRLFNRNPGRLQPILKNGGILIDGVLGTAKVPIACVTTDIHEAMEDCDVAFVVAPAPAHEYYAKVLAPVLSDGAVVMLNPGHTGGALRFSFELRCWGNHSDVTVCETNSNTYICRMTGEGKVSVWSLAKYLLFAAYPGKRTADAARLISEIYPSVVPVESVLVTGLSNLNATMHPAMVLLNVGWIEHTLGEFSIYYDAATPGISTAIEEVDKERLAVAQALGVRVQSFLNLFYQYGATTEDAARSGSVQRALLESAPNRGIKAPPTTMHRYITEDVPFGLVPMSALGRWAGVNTPVVDSLITLASMLNKTDYAKEGLTLEKMGLFGYQVGDLTQILHNGISQPVPTGSD